MKKTFFLLFILSSIRIYAQDTVKSLTFSGYLETYYSYDFGNPTNHERPSFFYSYNRHNEVNLNIGFAKASYNTDQVRGNLALMTGTYPQYKKCVRSQCRSKNVKKAQFVA